MNAQNAKEFLPLIRALADGKTIQYNDEGDWMDTTELMTRACTPEFYRIKPEPRTFEMWLSSGGSMYPWEAFPNSQPGMERITVLEVLK